MLVGGLAWGLWALSLVLFLMTRYPRVLAPVVVAHRGGAALAPENTLAAFRQAQDLEVDYLETDVRQTRDGVLVLLHDGSLERTTDGHGPVESISAESLARLRSRGERVPTFEEYLELARQRGSRILPEAKGRTAGLEKAMVEALTETGMLQRTVVQSFSLEALQRFQQLAPDLQLCHLYYPLQFWLGQNPTGVRVISPNAETLMLYPWLVRSAQRQGFEVWPWFAVAESDLSVAWMLALGVDGLMLDDPRRLRSEPRR